MYTVTPILHYWPLFICSGGVSFSCSSSSKHLSWVQVTGVGALAVRSRHYSPQSIPPALPGESQGVPRSSRRYNHSNAFSICSGVSSWMDTPETPPQGGAKEASPLPNHFNCLFLMQRTCELQPPYIGNLF